MFESVKHTWAQRRRTTAPVQTRIIPSTGTRYAIDEAADAPAQMAPFRH
jgi:hypothetical protein